MSCYRLVRVGAFTTALSGVLLLSAAVLADPGVSADAKPTCNWGAVTMEQTLAGFDTGGHSADPSGDGHGPGTADEPRLGLANVLEKGNLEATCVLIKDLLP